MTSQRQKAKNRMYNRKLFGMIKKDLKKKMKNIRTDRPPNNHQSNSGKQIKGGRTK